MGFKVNFNSRQFVDIEAKFRKDIKETLSQPAVMREIGQFLVERIRYQVRTESPLNSDSALPPLRPATVKHRRYLEKYNDTHATYETNRSNLTITGKFLDALTYLVKGPGLLDVFFAGRHPQYKGKGGKKIGKEVENADLVKWLAKKGFKVFDRAINENRTIKQRIRSIALRYIRRGLKVRNKLAE
jgi:hypothetical protein